METATSSAGMMMVPVALLTITSMVSLRRSLALVNRIGETSKYEEEDDLVVEGEEDLLPQPEPLGGSLAPPSRPRAAVLMSSSTTVEQSSSSRSSSAFSGSPMVRFTYERMDNKLPLDTDAAALRAKLIDADAAKRRAMVRLAELEKETENLRRRCAELERKTVVGEGLQQLGFTQRFLSMAVPHLKAGRRGVMWKTH